MAPIKTDSRGIEFDALDRKDVYNATLSNTLSNSCLSFLVGGNLLKDDHLSFSISSSRRLNKGIGLPI